MARGAAVAAAATCVATLLAPGQAAARATGTIAFTASEVCPAAICPSHAYLVSASGRTSPRRLPCSFPSPAACSDRFVRADPASGRLATGADAESGDANVALRAKSGAIRRRVPLKDAPSGLAWTLGGTALVLNQQGSLALLRGGSSRPRPLRRRVSGRTVSSSRSGKLVWNDDRYGGLVIADAAAHVLSRVGRRRLVALQPRWSNGGREVAYLNEAGAFRVTAAGGKPRRISSHCDYLAGELAWSPDDRDVACRSHAGQLIVVSVATGRYRRIGYFLFPESLDWTR